MHLGKSSATLLALGSILMWPVAAGAQSTPQQGSAADNTSAQTVSAEDLSDNPQNYYGKTVTVREQVEDVLGANLFTIDDGEFFGTSPNILVFAPNADASPRADNAVTVTGHVYKFTQADLEREYGWGWGAYPWGGYYGYPWYGTGYGPDYFVRYQNRPIIIASSVRTSSGRELVSNDADGKETIGALSGNAGAGGVVTDLGTISSGSAAQLNGREVRLSGITVDRLSGDHAFWTKTSQGQPVFVMLDNDIRQPQLRQGATVTVAGQLKKVPRDQSKIDAKQWGLANDDITQLMKSGVFVRAHALMTGNKP